MLAMILPLTGYFLVKSFSNERIAMPRHYIYDSVITKTVDGKQVSDTAWHILPDFKFQNQLGNTVSWKDMEGKVVIADFFFTHCPTICPRMTLNMKKLQDALTNGQRVGDKQAKFIHFLSFTVDPERDSVRQLKDWADRFQVDPSNWWLLTGPKQEIYDLSINHMRLGLIDGKGIDTNFIHSDRVVLIDKYRNIRGYYHGLDTASMGQLSRDLVLLSLEKDPKRKKFWEGKLELMAVVFLIALLGLGLLIFLLKKDKRQYDIGHNQER